MWIFLPICNGNSARFLNIWVFYTFLDSNPVVCCFSNFFARQRKSKCKASFYYHITKIRAETVEFTVPLPVMSLFCLLLLNFALKSKKNLSCLGRQKRFLNWCGWRGLNPHALRHRNLNPACLPIPSHPRIIQDSKNRPRSRGALFSYEYYITLKLLLSMSQGCWLYA